jgi:hypothetical protein
VELARLDAGKREEQGVEMGLERRAVDRHEENYKAVARLTRPLQ